MNYGRKIESVEHVTLFGAMKALNVLKSGQLCRVDALKADGTLRTYSSCRTGVRKGLKGTGMRYNAAEKGLITVYEFGVGHRTIAIDRIVGIKHGGTWYNLNFINGLDFPVGARRFRKDGVLLSHAVSRTIPASNSPLYGKN